MKKIDTYILEKLHINKDTKVSSEENSRANTIASGIAYICDIDTERKDNEDLMEKLEKYAKELPSNVESVVDLVCYCEMDKMKLSGRYGTLKANGGWTILKDNSDLVENLYDNYARLGKAWAERANSVNPSKIWKTGTTTILYYYKYSDGLEIKLVFTPKNES